MVEPEVGQHLFQLPLAINGAQQLRRLHFAVDEETGLLSARMVSRCTGESPASTGCRRRLGQTCSCKCRPADREEAPGCVACASLDRAAFSCSTSCIALAPPEFVHLAADLATRAG